MMTIDDKRGEGGKKCQKIDDVICERPLGSEDFVENLERSVVEADH
jgi:hypothetical protein